MVDASLSDGGSGQGPGDPSSPPSSQLSPGTLISGIYRLVRLLGVGGMGEVWEARHERTKGRVALKLLLPEMGRHEEVLRRFQREVEITSGLNHPNIVPVSDADKLPDGRPYLVMEFLEGRDLTSAAGRPMALGEVTEIIEQTAMGLHAAHGQSIIHRDLKPANIFLVPLPGTPRPLVKILDFGISKAMDGLSRLTQTRSVIGTPYYMAPEQATGGMAAMDARADQFSLAAIAYELLTGRMAFEGDGMVNVIYKVVNEAPRTFAMLGTTAPAGVEVAILRGLSKSASGRFGSVLEFSQALKRAESSMVVEPRALVTAPITRETLLLPTTPVATTLRASVGQIEVAAGGMDSPEGATEAATNEAELGVVKPSKRKVIGLLAGGAALAAGILAIVTLRGSPADPQPSPTSAAPLTQTAAPAAAVPTATVPTPAPAAAREATPEPKPAAPPPATARPPESPAKTPIPVPAPLALTPRKTKAKPSATKSQSPDREVPSRIGKAPTGKSARHPGPLNDDL
jgi:eukaryotic-like serine/threonine-protein kinase